MVNIYMGAFILYQKSILLSLAIAFDYKVHKCYCCACTRFVCGFIYLTKVLIVIPIRYCI